MIRGPPGLALFPSQTHFRSSGFGYSAGAANNTGNRNIITRSASNGEKATGANAAGTNSQQRPTGIGKLSTASIDRKAARISGSATSVIESSLSGSTA